MRQMIIYRCLVFVWNHSLIYNNILQEIMIEGTASYKVTKTNEPTEEGYFRLNYDGNIATVAGIENDRLFITQLDNEDIIGLLSRPAHHMSLIERLQSDYDDNRSIKRELQKIKKSRSLRRSKKQKK